MAEQHPNGWDFKTHYMSIGGQCGQSCPCCRSNVGDVLGSCPICNVLKNNSGKKTRNTKETTFKRVRLPRKCKNN